MRLMCVCLSPWRRHSECPCPRVQWQPRLLTWFQPLSVHFSLHWSLVPPIHLVKLRLDVSDFVSFRVQITAKHSSDWQSDMSATFFHSPCLFSAWLVFVLYLQSQFLYIFSSTCFSVYGNFIAVFITSTGQWRSHWAVYWTMKSSVF